ncbi:hypothetical protein SMICM304S_09916 [Streptomyces microflavus]
MTTPSMCSTAWGFSTLAMTGTRRPSSSITLCTSLTSSASRTKERATRSQPIRRAKRRSSMSFSERAGTFTAAPGRLMPLWSEMTPPSMTMVLTQGQRPDDLQLDVAVSWSDQVALGDVAGQTLVGRAADRLVAGDVLGRDGELVPAGPARPGPRRTWPGGSSGPGGRRGRPPRQYWGRDGSTAASYWIGPSTRSSGRSARTRSVASRTLSTSAPEPEVPVRSTASRSSAPPRTGRRSPRTAPRCPRAAPRSGPG